MEVLTIKHCTWRKIFSILAGADVKRFAVYEPIFQDIIEAFKFVSDEKITIPDNKLSEYDIAVIGDTTEDYQKNKKQCNKLYDMLEKGIIKGYIHNDSDYEYN